MTKKKLTDPVDEGKEQGKGELDEEMAQMLDPESKLPDGVLTEGEVGSVPVSATTAIHPFQGFHLGREIKVGESEISSTFIILLRDDDIFQDESGKRVSQAFFKKDGKGNDIRKEVDGKFYPPKVDKIKTVDLKSYHNRVTTHPRTGVSTDTVFDRQVKVGNRMRVCAVEPSHSARAQICLHLNKGKVGVDRRYQLADTRQVKRLRKVFDQANYQHMKAERLAKKFDSEQSNQGRGGR